MDELHPYFVTSLSLISMNQNAPTLASELAKRIKEARRHRGWTLEEFERQSSGAIKAVVLGSYERGSRSMSVRKLELIAQTLDVPVSFLLGVSNSASSLNTGLMIDIRKVRTSKTTTPIVGFFSHIITKRGDWNGEILSLRKSDLEILALMSGSNTEELSAYLRSEKFLLEPKLQS